MAISEFFRVFFVNFLVHINCFMFQSRQTRVLQFSSHYQLRINNTSAMPNATYHTIAKFPVIKEKRVHREAGKERNELIRLIDRFQGVFFFWKNQIKCRKGCSLRRKNKLKGGVDARFASCIYIDKTGSLLYCCSIICAARDNIVGLLVKNQPN